MDGLTIMRRERTIASAFVLLLVLLQTLYAKASDNPSNGTNRTSVSDCATAVEPFDYSPVRSPQAVHTAMLPLLAGKAVVEIGTRNGDGMACFARVAQVAVAYEMDQQYCASLRRRANQMEAAGNGTFRVSCQAVNGRSHLVDADVYTFWMEGWLQDRLLDILAQARWRGHIRPTAVALMVVDHSEKDQMDSLRDRRAQVEHSIDVHYDEVAQCHARYPGKIIIDGGKGTVPCKRAAGTITVAVIPIARIPYGGGWGPHNDATIKHDNNNATTSAATSASASGDAPAAPTHGSL